MASTVLLQPPSTTTQALATSQQAPSFLASQRNPLPYPLTLLSESQTKWQSYENIFLACLRTGDIDSANICLQELDHRFGKLNERVIAMQGLFREATAADDKELEEILGQYDDILHDDPSIFAIRRRRAALLRSMGRTSEAVTALTELLDASPTDAEAWAELADVYVTQGLYEQAIFCLEEVLLVTPNAWNMHARIGEVLYLSAGKAEGAEQIKGLSESLRRFCRSVELCDDYLRGYYGLKLTSSRLIPLLRTGSRQQKSTDSELPPPSLEKVKKLEELATSKLSEILRLSKSEYDGYSEAELIAARELLNRAS